MTISYRIKREASFHNAIFYRLSCSCGSDEHDLTIEFEYDPDIKDVTINFHKQLEWSAYWRSDNWFMSQWEKLKAIYRIIFWGYIEVEESLILDSPEHINSFIKALNEGRKKLQSN